MFFWVKTQNCEFKVGDFSTSCFYALRTRTDVPGDPLGPLYCVVFAVFGSRVFPHPIFFLPPRVVFMFTTQLILSTWSPSEVLVSTVLSPAKFCPGLLLYEVIEQFLYRPEFRF